MDEQISELAQKTTFIRDLTERIIFLQFSDHVDFHQLSHCWRSLESLVSALSERDMKVQCLTDHGLVSMVIESLSVFNFQLSKQCWTEVSLCFITIFSKIENFIWEVVDLSPLDVLNTLHDVFESCTNDHDIPWLIQCLRVTSVILLSSKGTDFSSEWYVMVRMISEILDRLPSMPQSIKKFSLVSQDILFSLTNNIVDYLSANAEEQSKDTLQLGFTTSLPLGGESDLLRVICLHREIRVVPVLFHSILKCHAALFRFSSASYYKSFSNNNLLQGFATQNGLVVEMLIRQYNNIREGVFTLTERQRLNIISTCAGLNFLDIKSSNNSLNSGNLKPAVLHWMFLLTHWSSFEVSTSNPRNNPVDSKPHNFSTLPPLQNALTHNLPLSVIFTEEKYGYLFLVEYLKGIYKVFAEGDFSLPSTSTSHTREVLEISLDLFLTAKDLKKDGFQDQGLIDNLITNLSRVLLEYANKLRNNKEEDKISESLQNKLKKGVSLSLDGCKQLLSVLNLSFHINPLEKSHEVVDLTKNTENPIKKRKTLTNQGGIILEHKSENIKFLNDNHTTSSSVDKWKQIFKAPIDQNPPPLYQKTSKKPEKYKISEESAFDRLLRLEEEQSKEEESNERRMRLMGVAASSKDFSWRNSNKKRKREDKKEVEEEQWRQQMRELRMAQAHARIQVGVENVEKEKPARSGQTGLTRRRSSWRQESSESESSGDEETGIQSFRKGDQKRHVATDNRRKIRDWRQFAMSDEDETVSKVGKLGAQMDKAAQELSFLQELEQAKRLNTILPQLSAVPGSKNMNSKSFADSLADVSIDGFICKVLKFDLQVLFSSSQSDGNSKEVEKQENLEPVPIRFLHEDHYVSIFQPLLLEEAKAALTTQMVSSRSSVENTELNDQNNTNHGFRSHPRNKQNFGDFKMVKLRVILHHARAGCPGLEEVHVEQQSSGRRDEPELIRDDLIMVMKSKLPPGELKLRDLLQKPHALALVLTSTRKRNNKERTAGPQWNSREEGGFNGKQTLLMCAGEVPTEDTVRTCVSVSSLSSFLREWTALQSIRSHQLMPLAPYLLKGSPVVSSQHLSALHNQLQMKIRQIEKARELRLSEKRFLELDEGLRQDLALIDGLRVDGSVLKNTGIGKTMKKLSAQPHSPESNNLNVGYSQGTVEWAGRLVEKWKAQVKKDNQGSTIMNLKGGKLVNMDMEDGGVMGPPRGLPAALWVKLTSSFNKSQLFAIKYVSDQFEKGQDTRITLVQGPPGTGKTSTIMGMAAALLHMNSRSSTVTTTFHSRRRLLLCACSNNAVDELLIRLSKGVWGADGEIAPLKVVRLGEPLEGSAQERAVRSFTLESQVEVLLENEEIYKKYSKVGDELKHLRLELNRLESTKETKGEIKLENKIKSIKTDIYLQRQTHGLLEVQMDRLRSELKNKVLQEADVVGATLSGSGKQQFLDQITRESGLRLNGPFCFDTAIVDEAAQTTEPACLIPLRLGCRRLVLVGDPRQLPATVLSPAAERAGLGRSLFERLERAEHEVVMLTIQYRMHPEIRQFPSNNFYQGMLTDAPELLRSLENQKLITTPIEEGEISPEADKEQVKTISVMSRDLQQAGVPPVLFLQFPLPSRAMSAGVQRPFSFGESKAGKSFVNEGEVHYILSLLEELRGPFRGLSVAVVAPYKAQVERLRGALRQNQTLQQEQALRRGSGGDDDDLIEVNTIDSFQGREKDVVIFSCVRCASEHARNSNNSSSRNNTHIYREYDRKVSESYNKSNNSNSNNRGGGIGFVADERRVNVALTRAKKALVVVGDPGTLASDPLWKSLLDSLAARGLVKVAVDPSNFRFHKRYLMRDSK